MLRISIVDSVRAGGEVLTVLVTGGAGFIGSSLVRRLVGTGQEVRVLDDLSTGLESNLDGLKVELIRGTFTDEASLAEATDGVDAIVHLGARGSVPRSIREPELTHEVNASGTLAVLEAARRHDAYVIFSGSSSVYGTNPALPKDEDMWTRPISPYGASKLAAESYCLAYRQAYQLDVLVLRFFNVYGPWQRPDHDYAAVIPKFAWAALSGLPLKIHGDGKQTRDFTHVNSVLDVIEQALSRRVTVDKPVNVAFGTQVAVNEVIEELSKQLDRPLDARHAEERSGDIRYSQNDPAYLRELFPSVDPVDFKAGVASVIDWMNEYRHRAHEA